MATGDIKGSGKNHPETIRRKNGVVANVWKGNSKPEEKDKNTKHLRSVTSSMADEDIMAGRGNWVDDARNGIQHKKESTSTKIVFARPIPEEKTKDSMRGRGNWADKERKAS